MNRLLFSILLWTKLTECVKKVEDREIMGEFCCSFVAREGITNNVVPFMYQQLSFLKLQPVSVLWRKYVSVSIDFMIRHFLYGAGRGGGLY